ncbi:MAG: hypothetical protein KDC79_13915 [Cyclobacteriaceae bacterium]|nr:hypothetical protein [Cyclobacteriaceae bacterium]
MKKLNKLDTYRRISKVHVIKCLKAKNDLEAIKSFNEATELKHELEQIKGEGELEQLIDMIRNWAGNNPIVTDVEVDQLIRIVK